MSEARCDESARRSILSPGVHSDRVGGGPAVASIASCSRSAHCCCCCWSCCCCCFGTASALANVDCGQFTRAMEYLLESTSESGSGGDDDSGPLSVPLIGLAAAVLSFGTFTVPMKLPAVVAADCSPVR